MHMLPSCKGCSAISLAHCLVVGLLLRHLLALNRLLTAGDHSRR